MKLDTCPKCGLKLPQPDVSCPKCGLIFAKFSAEKRVTYAADVVVTTNDLPTPYQILGPIYAGVTNQGRMLEELTKRYNIPFESTTADDLLRAFAGFEVPVHFQQLPAAFVVCLEQLKRHCVRAGGNAIIGFRTDTDIEAVMGSHHLYLQMYGTAVRTSGQPSSTAA